MLTNNIQILMILLMTLWKLCVCGCDFSSILYPLDVLSRQTHSNPSWLYSSYIDALHQNVDQPPGLNQWSEVIFNENTQKNKSVESIHVLETYISVFRQLIKFIMREKVEQNLMLITDLPPEDIFLQTFNVNMSNIHIEHVSVHQIERVDEKVLEIVAHDFRVVVLLLPWEIGERVMKSADQNYLINSGKMITWISFNMGERRKEKEWRCVHDIPLRLLVQATYPDENHLDGCRLIVNSTKVKDIGSNMIQTIADCELDIPTLTITTLVDHPFVILTEIDVDVFGGNVCINSHPCSMPSLAPNGTRVWVPSCCAGLVIDIIMEMKKSLRFNANIYGCPDRQYGSIVNESWTGMINEVASFKADMAVQGLTANAVRSSVVDFTTHFMLTSIGIVRKRSAPELSVVNWEFMKMLKADLVLGLVSSFAVVFIFLFTYENINHYVHKESYYPTREAFSYIAGLTFQRDLAGKTPHKWSARFVAIVYAIAMTIVMTTYTANLTANNLTETAVDDFQGLKDPKITDPTPAFVYGVRMGTSTVLYFKENIQPRLSMAYNTFIKYYLTKTNNEGLYNVRSGKFGAFVGDYAYLLYKIVTPEFCSTLTIHKESSLDFPLAFAVQKKSKWKNIVSEKMRTMEEEGSLQEITNKWFFLPKCFQNTAQANEFPWEYIGGMLVAMGAFVLLSVFVVALETFYTRRKSKTSIFHGIFSVQQPTTSTTQVIVICKES